MLAVVAKLMRKGGDDVAAPQQQIHALKVEGAEASEEVDRLKRERAQAASYDEARDLDDRIARQIWVTELCAAAIPRLELQMGAVRAAALAAALARHARVLIDLYPRLKAAVRAAVDAQEEAMAAHEAACREIGEAEVFRNLPSIGYAGFLRSELYSI
jgi:hypothetical protein